MMFLERGLKLGGNFLIETIFNSRGKDDVPRKGIETLVEFPYQWYR